MTLVALLSWFDERPDWLRDTVLSLAKLRVDCVVCLDGAYRLFPGAAARSHPDNYAAIYQATRLAGIDLVRATPEGVWGSEMEKRSKLFEIAEKRTDERDWYFVIDADTVVLHSSIDLKATLADTDLDVAAVRMVEPSPDGSQKQFRLPMFFRACRGLYVERNHYTYVTGDGRRLWGRGKTEPQLDLTNAVLCEHRSQLRDPERWDRAHRYYRLRDEAKVEVGTCELCPKPGVTELPTDWRPGGEGRLTSVWISVCEDCERKVRAENDRVIRSYGLDPETIQVTFEKSMLAA